MAARPANLIYGVDDVPPPAVLFLLALQHVFLMSSTLVLPIVLVSQVSGDFTLARSQIITTSSRWKGRSFRTVRSR